ncbi:MAG: transcriptional activator NhaR [Polyangiaceae bacterium]
MEWLNYHHLFYFWLAAKEGGVSRAAKKLRLAQPTLSGQIRALGESLGGDLFERRGRGLVLTDLGQIVFRHADEIFGIGRDLLDAVKGRSTGRLAKLVVGVSDVLPKLVVYRMLEPAFALPEPLRVICREDDGDRLVAALAAHEVDLVLTDAPLAPGSGTRAFNHVLGESGTTFFAAPKLAPKASRAFPDSLAGMPMVVPCVQSVMRRELDAWFDARGVHPRIVAEVEDSALAKVLGQAGIGVFAAPTAIERELVEQYSVKVVGRVPELRERYYAISLERRLRHPGVVAISSAARALLGT